MEDIDQLFAERDVVSTGEVASAFDMSEAVARAWAEELDVAKVGASFAWVRDDVEALDDALEALDEEDEEDEEDEDDEDEDGEDA